MTRPFFLCDYLRRLCNPTACLQYLDSVWSPRDCRSLVHQRACACLRRLVMCSSVVCMLALSTRVAVVHFVHVFCVFCFVVALRTGAAGRDGRVHQGLRQTQRVRLCFAPCCFVVLSSVWSVAWFVRFVLLSWCVPLPLPRCWSFSEDVRLAPLSGTRSDKSCLWLLLTLCMVAPCAARSCDVFVLAAAQSVGQGAQKRRGEGARELPALRCCLLRCSACSALPRAAQPRSAFQCSVPSPAELVALLLHWPPSAFLAAVWVMLNLLRFVVENTGEFRQLFAWSAIPVFDEQNAFRADKVRHVSTVRRACAASCRRAGV